MARDLLSVQASTVASESAFSLSGRVLSIRRTRLTPASLEMCICLKDHLDAQELKQHTSNLEGNSDGNLRELSGEEAWEAIENFAQGQKEWDNPPNIIFKQEVANLKAQLKRLIGNEDVWVEMHRDISLGDKRGIEPPIKSHSPDSFRMKVVDNLTIHTPSSSLVASSDPNDMYCYYRPCIDDPKRHYRFKPGLLGHSGSLGVDFSKSEMIEDDLELESKEVCFLGRGLNSPVRKKEVEKVRIK
ncbi:ribonuclease H-like domain-containing protein [Tanacetum coccineum]